MFCKACFFANILEQIFQPARRPCEDLVHGLILSEIFFIGSDPIFFQFYFAFLVTIGRAGITDKNVRSVLRIQEFYVIDVDTQAFTFF